MAKKTPKIKHTGTKPEGNVLSAAIPNSLMGKKVGFPHRHSQVIDTGLTVSLEKGYKLCFRLATALANRGMVATNAPGNFTDGKVFVNLLNCGREIVEVRDGDPLVEVWVEQVIDFNWEEEE